MRHGLATLNSNNSVVYCQKHKVYIKIHHTALNSVLVLLGGGGGSITQHCNPRTSN